ncbi:hypothetical protein OAJ60_05495 [Planctomycetaceae bacterium]|nr:hypothetical protein [Planctomycetaceae bacterium]
MSFPSCPACQQSVLDDDATHCPFCGAAMSGDGGPDQGNSGESPSTTTSASPPDNASDDAQPQPETEPFPISSKDIGQFISAAPKPTKKRPWRIHCPMCDSPGFVPRQAAGKEIKCANPECLVPIFTAPEAPDTKPASEPEPQETSTTSNSGLLIVAILVLLAGGGGAWWFLGRSARPTDAPPTTPIAQLPASAPGNTSDSTLTKKTETPPATVENTAGVTTTVSRKMILERAPAMMVAAAQERDRNRSKPFCRRLTAEYYAESGNEADALAQLKQLTQIGPDLPHLHINALVSLWWRQQKDGAASSGPHLSEAIKRSANISPSSPFAVDVTVGLGCALIASDQIPLAESTIARLWSPIPTARLRLDQLRCRYARTFHLPSRHSTPPSLRGAMSPDSLIIAQLCDRGFSATALSWARQATHLFDRSERLAAWATGTQDRNIVDKEMASESPTTQAVVYARLALVDALDHDTDSVSTAVSKTTKALQQCAKPRTVALGDIKQTFLLPIDGVTDWWLKVRAEAELLGALSADGQAEQAADLFANALATARSIGPGYDDVAARLQTIKSLGTTGMTKKMMTVLDLMGNDEARQASQQYTKKCQNWLQLANQRATCLQRLHRWAISHRLQQESWNDIQKYGLTTDISIRDPFTKSTLPSHLYLSFQAEGNTAATKAMNSVLPPGLPIDATESLRLSTFAALDAGKLDAVLQAVTSDANARRNQQARNDRRRILYELTARAATSETPARALELINIFRDSRFMIWQESASRLVAAQLALNGHHAIAWNFATHSDRPPTIRVALLYGILSGLSTPTAKDGPET